MTNLTIGQKINTPELWDELPIGATVTDAEGWIHAKVRNYSPETGRATTTWVDPETDQRGTFIAPWRWGAVLTSLPEPERPAFMVGDRVRIVRAGAVGSVVPDPIGAIGYLVAVDSGEGEKMPIEVGDDGGLEWVDHPFAVAESLDARRCGWGNNGGPIRALEVELAPERAEPELKPHPVKPHPEIGATLAWKDSSPSPTTFGVKPGDLVTVTGHSGHNSQGEPCVSITPCPRPDLQNRWSTEWFEVVDEVEEMKDAVADAIRELDATRRELETLRVAAAELQDDLEATKAAAREEIEGARRLVKMLEEAGDTERELQADSKAAHAALSYALELLDPEAKARVLGYWDGVKDATA